MASRDPSPELTPAQLSLQENIERTRREQARLEAEHGDLEAFVDQFAEEMFGTPEATEVLVDYVLRSSGVLDPEEDDEDADDDVW